MQQHQAPLIAVDGLRVSFGAQQAVRDVSFTIAPGETLGLVGESGSGKSATSFALMRLLPPTATVSGSVRLYAAQSSALATHTHQPHWVKTEAGLVDVAPPTPSSSFEPGTCWGEYSASRDLLKLPERDMRTLRGREIAMIFQEPMTALNPVMTVGRQIAEALLAHAPRSRWGGSKLSRHEVRERVLAAMREVALPEPERRIDDYPHQFSGGQRQRIVIAMALLNKPRLLIADEPTTALDVTVQAQVLELLKTLREEHNLAMLFISHDLAVVSQVADRVAVMRHGEIVESGAMRDVLTRPQHPYTRSLLASVPTMSTDRERPLATV